MKKKRAIIFKVIILFFLAIFLWSKFDIFNNPILSGSSSADISNEFSLSENYKNLDAIYSRNAIVVDKTKGEVILGKNRTERIHPASMTKVMTAILGIEKSSNLSKRVTITNDTIDYCKKNGMSVSGFEEGDRPKLKDLLYGIMLESGGEASIALARELAGSEDAFVDLMNQKAREIGMHNSHFANSTGITSTENYSTAEDIAKLFNYALSNKTFKEVITSKAYDAKGIKGWFTKHKVVNNVFMKRNSLDMDKNYLIGGKTGYTKAAGLCLVSYGSVNDKEYIVVTAKATGDSTTPQYNFMDLASIYKKIEN